MQGNLQAGFIEVNSESAFLLFAIGEDGYQSLEAFPRMLFVPPEVRRITVTETTVDRGHGSL